MRAMTAFTLGVATGLIIGVTTGAALAGEPVTRTPSACHAMADTAIEAFQLWKDVAKATTDRDYAPDATTRAVHDAEVQHLIEALEEVAPKYDRAAADCVGEP